ncbi:1096_t:CDS:2 [Funneliformis caledonium]|uniref:1096_t:CDS:1 n=1 Tax=Funneliformis caledonium TaxID=1117310 RepID=A0A9N9F9A5_9GLOM|nr:1096_t:CDS:2 [Funneliformis caledonium]
MNTVIKFNKLNSFISILLLFSLFTLFNEVTAIAIETRNAEFTEFCNGFQFISPKAGDKFLKNDKIEVVWTNGHSIIEQVNNIDLYNSTSGKFVKSLWRGTRRFGVDGKASVNVKLAVPKHTELPGEFILKSWGTTLEGPSCFTISGNFTIDPKLC